MPYTFRKALRENSSVLVALAGHTGTGKTKSALRLARGIAGEKGRIVMLDTESGRGTHYSDQHDYDYAELKPPFSPQTYREAIEAAEAAKYDVIIIDSMSHEWSGDGGCADMQAEALERLSQGDARRMERLTAPAWKEAKIAHKKLMSRLLQTRSTVIFALRAEPKIKFVKVRGDDGRERTVIEDMGFQPICEKSFMFEMTVSFMIDEQHLPRPIKLGEQFRPMFPLDKPITEESGKRLAEWAKGGTVQKAQTTAQAEVGLSLAPGSVASGGVGRTDTLINLIHTALTRYGFAGDSAAQIKKRSDELEAVFGVRAWADVQALDPGMQREGLEKLRQRHEPAA